MKHNYPVIMICGFYGAGNSGDEAMLHNFVRHMKARSPEVRILIATDRYGGWLEPNVYYVSAMDRSKLQECDMFVLGGGDLEAGFGWHMLLEAKRLGLSCIKLGVSVNDTFIDGNIKNAVKASLKLFDKIYVRDDESKSTLDYLGVDCKVTSDIAVDLNSHTIDFVRYSDKEHVTLVIREVYQHHREKMTFFANEILNKITEDCSVTLLPFSREDSAFISTISNLWCPKAQTIVTFAPEQHKHIVCNSDYLISLGRFHPLVYSLNNSVPTLAIDYPLRNGYSKIKAWMKYIDCSDNYLEFESMLSCFDEKWKLLRDTKAEYKAKTIPIYEKLAYSNSEQFNEVITMAHR